MKKLFFVFFALVLSYFAIDIKASTSEILSDEASEVELLSINDIHADTLDEVINNYKTYYKNWSTVTSDGFIIYFDFNLVTMDQAQHLADEYVLIKRFFCESSYYFYVPASDDNQIMHVFIEDRATLSYAGKAETLDGSINSYIRILYPSVSSGSFEATAAHEYFHTIYTMYKIHSDGNYNYFTWFGESLAKWAGILYSVQKNDLSVTVIQDIDYQTYTYLSTSNMPLDYYSEKEADPNYYRYYSVYLFWLYIYQEYGMTIIEELIIESYQKHNDSFMIFEEVFANYNTNLATVFEEFSVFNAFPVENYIVVPDKYKKDWKNGSIKKINDTINQSNEIQYLSSHYIELTTDCSSYNVNINIHTNDSSNLKVNVISEDSNGNRYVTSMDFTNGWLEINLENFLNPLFKKYMLVFTNTSKSSNVEYTCDIIYTHDELRIYEGDVRNITQCLHRKSVYDDYRYQVRFVPTKTGFYELFMNVEEDYNVATIIKVLDASGNVISRLPDGDYGWSAFNNTNKRNLVMFLKLAEFYYIDIQTDRIKDMSLSINRTSNEITFDSSSIYLETFTSEKKIDNILIFKPQYSGTYELVFQYSGVTTRECLYFIYKQSSLGINKEVFERSTDNTITVTSEIMMQSDETLYIGYLNIDNIFNSTLSIERIHSDEIILITDPVWAAPGSLGSEVTVNGGINGGTTITTSYTRSIHFDDNAPDPSRLSYYWYSSDESVARVSVYGTVTALTPGIVVISAVYKSDSSKIGEIELTVITDQSPNLRFINVTTDVREDSSQNGTEVKSGLGIPGETTIHIGYTRMICIVGNAPTFVIQDYNFMSSNLAIITVSQYGTVKAVSSGEAYINIVNKYNNKIVGYIFFTVF